MLHSIWYLLINHNNTCTHNYSTSTQCPNVYSTPKCLFHTQMSIPCTSHPNVYSTPKCLFHVHHTQMSIPYTSHQNCTNTCRFWITHPSVHEDMPVGLGTGDSSSQVRRAHQGNDPSRYGRMARNGRGLLFYPVKDNEPR